VVAPTMKVRLVSPVAVVFEGEAAGLVAPAYDGQVGILPNHAPFITLLGGGTLNIELPGGGSTEFFVNRGVLKVEDNDVVILTEYAGTKAPVDFDSSQAWLELDASEPDEMGYPGNPLV